MNRKYEGNKYLRIYNDFLHPNPNINAKAVEILKKDFASEFMNTLLKNLEEEDIALRRKSILALGQFGEESFPQLVKIYNFSNNKMLRVSCLKTIIKAIVNFNIKELSKELMVIIDLAIKDDSPEITLVVISLLRQLGNQGKNILMKTCRDENLLRAKASVSALLEINGPDVDNLLNELMNDESIDPMIKKDII
tara:strand:- start:151 stop:732 length:582 start_codon:yes stop_codon:yes gene_type:complete